MKIVPDGSWCDNSVSSRDIETVRQLVIQNDEPTKNLLKIRKSAARGPSNRRSKFSVLLFFIY